MITLMTLKDATAQEVFDQVAEHLLKQNKQSDDGQQCKYRHEDLKCAAGCLISDEEYNSDMEANNWRRLVSKNLVPDHHLELIQALQKIHDACEPKEWRGKLRVLAIEYNLNYKQYEPRND